MSELSTYAVTATENLDFSHDYSDELGADTISTSTWAIAPTGPTISGQTNVSGVVTAFVTGASPGVRHRLRNTAVTAAGRTFTTDWYIWGEA